MRFLTFIPAVLAVACVSGAFRPWSATAAQWAEGGRIFALVSVWAALPALLGLGAFFVSVQAAWRMSIGIYLTLLGIFWFVGSVITLSAPDFDGNIGLILWPVIHFLGLLIASMIGAVAAKTGANQRPPGATGG
jgi:hypothetical protein